MHVVITVLTILASLKWGNWKEWEKYHASMLFIATGGLLYEFIVKENTLWKFHPDILYGHDMTVMVYALITMPISIFLYLSHFPKKFFQQVLYILVWSIVYISVEWVLFMFERISYQKSWTIWYSFLFDLMMFSVIALHQRHPLRAYGVSIIIIIFMVSYFDVPFKILK